MTRARIVLGLAIGATMWLAAGCADSPGHPGDGSGDDGHGTEVADGADESPVDDAPAEGTDGESGADAAVDDGEADSGPPDPGIYAAPDGAGTDCTLLHPCTLTAARDKARIVLPTATADVVVFLRGGRYELAETFVLDGTLDSGRADCAVIYRAYADERPVLSGGRVVSGWTLVDAARNLWRAPVPAGLATRQLYVDGVRAFRTRGGYRPAGFVRTTTGYTAPDAALAGWRRPTDLEVVGLRYWKAFRCGVAAAAGTALTIDEPCWSLAQAHTGYGLDLPTWLENAYELLGTPGQFYLDGAESMLYYVPRGGEDPATAELIVPVLETLVRGSGTVDAPLHDVRFEGLTFAEVTWLGPDTPEGYAALQAGYHLVEPVGSWTSRPSPANVAFAYAQRVELRRCAFERLGAYGLAFERGSSSNLVEGCAFRDLSGGAIRIGEVDQPNATDPREVATGNVVRNCYVAGTGREFFDHVGIFVGYTDGTVLEHNELHDLPYTGISVGWGWSPNPTVARANQVRNNLVHHAMQRLEDGGLIYTLGAQPESRIEGNFFHDLIHPYGGIYLDNGTTGYTATGNVVASAPYWYLIQPAVEPFATNNVLQGNYADTDSAFCCTGLGCCTDAGRGNVVSDNLVFAPGAWPAATLPILGAAGLEPAWLDVRPAETRVEAEAYRLGGEGVGYHDLTPGNAGGGWRADDVDLYPLWTASGDEVVGWTQTDEWLRYVVDARWTRSYTFAFSVATIDEACAIRVAVDGVEVGTVALPNTGSYQALRTVELPGVPLVGGPRVLTLTFVGGFNLDWFSFR